MTQKAYPIDIQFKAKVEINIELLRAKGHSSLFISKVLKQVAKNHVGAEKKFLLMKAKQLSKNSMFE